MPVDEDRNEGRPDRAANPRPIGGQRYGIVTAAVLRRRYVRVGMNYGRGRWRKRKGVAMVRLLNGKLRRVERHWYEAHGIGRRDFKIKAYLDES